MILLINQKQKIGKKGKSENKIKDKIIKTEGQVLSASTKEAFELGDSRQPNVRSMPQTAHAVISRHQLLYVVVRVLWGCIVNYDQLKICKSLTENALNCLLEQLVIGTPIARQEHGDHWRGRCLAASWQPELRSRDSCGRGYAARRRVLQSNVRGRRGRCRRPDRHDHRYYRAQAGRTSASDGARGHARPCRGADSR